MIWAFPVSDSGEIFRFSLFFPCWQGNTPGDAVRADCQGHYQSISLEALPATIRFAVRQLLELICVPDVALRHNLGDSHAFSPALAYRRSYSDHHHPVAFHRPRLKGFIFHIVFRGIDRWLRQS
jgi:hypothetical protein